MASYPTSYFSWTNRADGVSIVDANDPNSLAAEIIAIEDALGLSPAGSAATLVARLNTSLTSLGGLNAMTVGTTQIVSGGLGSSAISSGAIQQYHLANSVTLPSSVNINAGAVSSPNFANTSTISWTVVGSNISGTASLPSQSYPIASTSVLGITELNIAPVSPSIPIALGVNDPSVTNARVPTGSAGGALSGSYPNPTAQQAFYFEQYGAVATGGQMQYVVPLLFNAAILSSLNLRLVTSGSTATTTVLECSTGTGAFVANYQSQQITISGAAYQSLITNITTQVPATSGNLLRLNVQAAGIGASGLVMGATFTY